MALAARDYKKILEIIDLAYSVRDRATLFQAVLEKFEKLIGVSSGGYIPWNQATRDFQFDGHVLLNVSPKVLSLYLSHYAQMDPFIQSGSHLTTALNRAVKITDVMPASRYAETPYAREFSPLIPCFYEMNAVLNSQGTPMGAVALHRKRRDRDFSERAREILNILAPHLSRAVHNLVLLETVSSFQGVGVVRIDRKGTAVFINNEARRALNGRPVHLIPDPGNGHSPVEFRSETGCYRVRTVQTPWDGQEKIIFLEMQPPEKELNSKLAVFGLTGRQREVASLVIRGLSNREIAARLFICEQTVKDHLHDIFEQVHVHSRNELTAKLLGLSSALHS